MKLSGLTASEVTIAAKMNGMDYGKYSFLVECGKAPLPPLDEIRAQMVVQKKRRDGEVRAVMQYSLKGEYIATYPSAADATEALGRERRTSGNICNACSGKAASAFGYQWRYEGDNPPGVYINRGSIPIKRTQRVDKVCVLCGKPYKGLGRSLYCSSECAKAAQRDNNKRFYEKNKQPPKERQLICKQCGKPFTATHGRAIFCSDRCRIDNGWMAQRDRKKAQNRKESA